MNPFYAYLLITLPLIYTILLAQAITQNLEQLYYHQKAINKIEKIITTNLIIAILGITTIIYLTLTLTHN